MAKPTTTRPGSIASRLKSFGIFHAALRIQSGEAVSELDRRKAAALARDKRSAGDSARHPRCMENVVRSYEESHGEWETSYRRDEKPIGGGTRR